MYEEMVTVASFANPVEAEMAKNELEAAGIPAFLMGETSGTLFAGFSGLFGSIRLMVSEVNQERALAVIDGIDEEEEDEPPEEKEPEGGTAIKAPDWKRRSAPTDGDTSLQSAPGGTHPRELVQGAAPGEAADFADESDDKDDEEEGPDAQVAWGPNELARRAGNFAVIGVLLSTFVLFTLPMFLLIVPLLLHLYSLRLLFQIPAIDQLKPSSKLKVIITFLIDVAVLGFVALVMLGMLSLLFRR